MTVSSFLADLKVGTTGLSVALAFRPAMRDSCLL
jgi:hypothetical protein